MSAVGPEFLHFRHHALGRPYSFWSSVKHKGDTVLLLVLLGFLRRPFIAVILPRLCLIACRYSQAMIIDLTIQFVSDSEVDSFLVTDGRSLIVFAIVVYVGLAVCKDPDPSNLYLDKMTT
jgi:uncharacterized membrane protein